VDVGEESLLQGVMARASSDPCSCAAVKPQLREAFPYDSAPRYLVFDRGTNFDDEVIDTMKTFGIQPKRTSFESPWQIGVGALRWQLPPEPARWCDCA
jgi:hypothetical protein